MNPMNKINSWSSMTIATQRSQQGATLIIVLMVVLLLAIIGAMSVRNSQVSLDMTTSAQVNQLLMQSSDVPLAKLDMTSVESDPTTKLTRLQEMALNNNGPIGALKTEGRKNEEYVLCYQPLVRDKLYDPGKHRILLSSDGNSTTGDSDGFCKLSIGDNAYTSKRGTVASQVAMTRPTVNDSTADDIEVKPLSALNTGMDNTSARVSEAAYFRSYVTSVLPALSISSNTSDIEDCLKLPIGGLAEDSATTSQILCLDGTDTPINIQVQDYAYNIEAK